MKIGNLGAAAAVVVAVVLVVAAAAVVVVVVAPVIKSGKNLNLRRSKLMTFHRKRKI